MVFKHTGRAVLGLTGWLQAGPSISAAGYKFCVGAAQETQQSPALHVKVSRHISHYHIAFTQFPIHDSREMVAALNLCCPIVAFGIL